MTRRCVLGWCLGVAVAVAGCGGTTQPSPSDAPRRDGRVPPELARKLQGVLDRQREFYELPGVAAALVIPGTGTWGGGSGVADRQTAARVTPRTTFAIASITKAFVGALALKLAEQGRVSLDEPLAAALRREISDPLGLRDVALQPQERPSPRAAHGYAPAAGGRREHDLSDGSGFVPYRSLASASWTAGGIVASAPSVAAFGHEVLRGKLLGRAARQQMTDFQDTGGGPGYGSYALGMGQTYANELSSFVWAAFGNYPGFGSTLAHLPTRGITVAVLANRGDSEALTEAIAEALIATATERS